MLVTKFVGLGSKRQTCIILFLGSFLANDEIHVALVIDLKSPRPITAHFLTEYSEPLQLFLKAKDSRRHGARIARHILQVDDKFALFNHPCHVLL